MSSRLSEDLRTGYRQVAEEVPEEWAALLARARDSINGGRGARNQCLAEVIVAYRCGPRQLWAPVLLDLLAPSIIARLKRLRPQPPAVDEEEIRQQFLVEVLEAAAFIPLPLRPAWQKWQILSRANQAVRRWLVQERCRQQRQRSFEAMDEERQ